MIRIFLFLVFSASCVFQSVENEPSFFAEQINYRGHHFDVVKIDPLVTKIQFFLSDENEQKFRSIENLKNHLQGKGKELGFAMNGGMYLKDGFPQGLYIENGKAIKALDTLPEGYGNFYLQPNGVFYLTKNGGTVCTTKDFSKTKPPARFATQSGPMLVIDGMIHDVFKQGSTHVHIRNGIGIDAQGKVVFAISNDKLNLYDFALLFKEKLHCKNALYLDGFVSRAYIPALERTDLDGNFGVIIGVAE